MDAYIYVYHHAPIHMYTLAPTLPNAHTHIHTYTHTRTHTHTHTYTRTHAHTFTGKEIKSHTRKKVEPQEVKLDGGGEGGGHPAASPFRRMTEGQRRLQEQMLAQFSQNK